MNKEEIIRCTRCGEKLNSERTRKNKEGHTLQDPESWRRSVQMADRLGIKHPAQGQQFLTEYQCR